MCQQYWLACLRSGLSVPWHSAHSQVSTRRLPLPKFLNILKEGELKHSQLSTLRANNMNEKLTGHGRYIYRLELYT